MQERSQIHRLLLVPTWAKRIEVSRSFTDLIVSGWDTPFRPLEREFFPDLKDLLDGFDKGRRLSRDQSRKSPHLRFAGANTPEKQVEFVSNFGPVLASKIENPEQTDIKPLEPDTVAHQKLAVLNIEQRLFSQLFALTRIVCGLREWSKHAVQLEKVYDLRHRGTPEVEIPVTRENIARGSREFDSFLAIQGHFSAEQRVEIARVGDVLCEIQDLMDSYPKNVLWEFDDPFHWNNPWSMFCKRAEIDINYSLSIFRLANSLLCHVFHLFPPSLDHVNGIVHEIPQIKPSGIRPILYYMLRLEYLYQRELKLCADPLCGRYFPPPRGNALYCSDTCQNNAKQRRHTKRAGLDRYETPAVDA